MTSASEEIFVRLHRYSGKIHYSYLVFQLQPFNMKHVVLAIFVTAIFNDLYAQVPRFKYHIKNRTIVTNGDHKLTKMVIIMPLAQTNQYQTVSQVDLNGGELVKVPNSEDVYVRWTMTNDLPSFNQSKEIFYNFDVTLNRYQFDFNQVTTIYPYDKSSDIYRWYTGSCGPFVDPQNPLIMETGNLLWDNSTDILDYARKCYEHVALNFRYLNPLTGLHPLSDLFSDGGGDCGNLSSIFVSLLRYKGIPARHIVTVRPNGTYHVWADFYLEKYGWIPVDVTYKNSNPRGDYFGKFDGYGIIMTSNVWLPIDKGNGDVYNSEILQNFNWWIWFDSGSQFNLRHMLSATRTPINVEQQMVTDYQMPRATVN